MISWGCEFTQPPVEKIYKAKPTNTPEEKILKEVTPMVPATSDSIIPSDSTSTTIKDTTESLHQIEKKPEIRPYKKLYLYNIHKRAYVS
jgi:hypothetical protein